jgi:hypothetical protein
MDRNFRIEQKRLLAVEGKDECNFFSALLVNLSISRVQVVDIGGKNKFSVELPLIMNLEGFGVLSVVGFVRDAEEHTAGSAFDSICATLKKNHLPMPTTTASVVAGPPKVGVFIMPDNQGSGMLEDLCLKTLNGQSIENCINEYMDCISSNISAEERERFNEPKARVQAYLSSRAPIVNSVGLAAGKGYWDFENPCFDGIKNFLRNLFDET